ncbi:MAG: acyltransferase family protein [Phocaeicola sp.]
MENPKRLRSLDILRGFDMFCLVALSTLLWRLKMPINAPLYDALLTQFTHKSWEGFAFWDLIMPLFMFMAGVSIPFAFSNYVKDGSLDRKRLYFKIARRFVLLWVLGMLCQGNLLALDFNQLRLFSNTLQSIAVGYLGASLLFLNCKMRTQIIVTIALLILYGVCMEWIGKGDYTPTGNLAEKMDRAILGRFRDGVWYDEEGNWHFSATYHYTWILSSLNFIVTVMLGLFTGRILKGKQREMKKVAMLLFMALLLILGGWIWHLQMPVIKPIWSSSMTLVSGGYCVALMALFYYVIDVKGHYKYVEWLKVYGMNSIVAYTLANVVSFQSISTSLFFGLEQYLGLFYGFAIALSDCALLFALLYVLYKQKIFVRV